MISIPGVDGDRDKVRLLREGAREDTVMSLCLAVELDTLMPVSGEADRLMVSGCTVVVMVSVSLLVACLSLTSILPYLICSFLDWQNFSKRLFVSYPVTPVINQ